MVWEFYASLIGGDHLVWFQNGKGWAYIDIYLLPNDLVVGLVYCTDSSWFIGRFPKGNARFHEDAIGTLIK